MTTETKTMIVWGIALEVEFEYEPGEPPTGPTYSCGGTPGYPPCAELISVKPASGQDDILEMLSEKAIDAICEKAVEIMSEGD